MSKDTWKLSEKLTAAGLAISTIGVLIAGATVPEVRCTLGLSSDQCSSNPPVSTPTQSSQSTQHCAQPTVPVLKSPGDGSKQRSEPWRFEWLESDCAGGSIRGYRIVIKAADSSGNDIDEIVDTPDFVDGADMIRKQGAPVWTWKVQAIDDRNQVSDWSEKRRFYQIVENASPSLPTPPSPLPRTSAPSLAASNEIEGRVRNYFKAINKGDFDAAYNSFSNRYKRDVSPQQYQQAFLGTLSLELLNFRLIDQGENQARAFVEFEETNDRRELVTWNGTMEFEKEGNTWYIERMKDLQEIN